MKNGIIILLIMSFEIASNQSSEFRQSNRFILGDTKQKSASIGIGDIDNDGDMDAVVANGRHWPQTNLIFVNFFVAPFTNTKYFEERLSIVRRALFSRSLRLMPLPQQVGVVEGLGVIVNELPGLLPMTDQHLLAFLSELLKMASVADGEMSDKTLMNSVVDKNGFVGSQTDSNLSVYPSHASALFFRRECAVTILGKKVVVPEELPAGVQLRVSSINLLHAVIRAHSSSFFDAETASPIGTYIHSRHHIITKREQVATHADCL